MPVIIKSDLQTDSSPFPHYWEHCVGSGHAPLALRADWQAQLKYAREKLGFKYVRFHGILSDDVGTYICHREEFLDSYFNADQIYQFLLSIDMKPFVELSFMPKTLASGHDTVFNYAANITPPKDMSQWKKFISKTVSHWEDHFGAEEIRDWFFEVWNEPNLDHFWTGSQSDYFDLYEATAYEIKGIDENLRVGGPATAKDAWVGDFLEFCDKKNVPRDFVSTHHYPTDAFGSEGDDTEDQLAKSERSVLREQMAVAKKAAGDLPLYYTEWNSSSNPRDTLHDEPYAAAFIAKTIMEAQGLVEGYSFWTFSDIFEENYFPSTPFHGGFGLLNIHGIPKPNFRAYELLHQLGDSAFSTKCDHSTVDAWVTSNTQIDSITALVTNFALPRRPVDQENIRLELKLDAQPRFVSIQRVDDEHANATRHWKEMGSPKYLKPAEVDKLISTSELSEEKLEFSYEGGVFAAEFPIQAQSVNLIRIDCDAP